MVAGSMIVGLLCVVTKDKSSVPGFVDSCEIKSKTVCTV